MSMINTLVETVARIAPDKERDPLLDREGVLGKPLSRVDADVKVTGAARFTAEYDVPGVAHAVLVHSTIAKGRVLKIDTGRARRARGVIEVLTYRNMPKMKAPPLVDMTDLKKGMAASDLPILQDSSVHWDGEP